MSNIPAAKHPRISHACQFRRRSQVKSPNKLRLYWIRQFISHTLSSLCSTREYAEYTDIFLIPTALTLAKVYAAEVYVPCGCRESIGKAHRGSKIVRSVKLTTLLEWNHGLKYLRLTKWTEINGKWEEMDEWMSGMVLFEWDVVSFSQRLPLFISLIGWVTIHEARFRSWTQIISLIHF